MKQLIEAIKSGNISTFSSPDVKVYAPSFTQVGNTSLLYGTNRVKERNLLL